MQPDSAKQISAAWSVRIIVFSLTYRQGFEALERVLAPEPELGLVQESELAQEPELETLLAEQPAVESAGQ